jgi:cobalt-zinc-cadmium efflux system membrane fusion protein
MSMHANDERSRRPLGRTALITGGLALFAAGAVVSALLMGRGTEKPHAPETTGGTTPAASAPTLPATGSLPDVTVPVSADVAARAGIEVTAAKSRVVAARLRLPGTVQPDEYRQVVVTPFVNGRVTAVSVELGDRVQRGAPMARIYSSDLADAQAKYASMRAELVAAEQRVARTTRLVEIGAASRQELEADEAMRARLAAEVQGAGARLRELGLSTERAATTPSAASASVTVPAPLTGIVTTRKANIGLVVDPASQLFTVASLSPVWVIADVQEADLSKVRVGGAATVVADAFPDRRITGTVSYISPELRPETRTAQLRVEVPNPGGDLRFGMFVNVELVTPQATAAVTVPADAVQTIGERTFVYVAPSGRSGDYVEREVRVGARDRESVEILRGVKAGDQVVTKGSFLVRAERERLGLRPPESSGGSQAAAAASDAAGRVVKVVVNSGGFVPNRIPAGPGSRLTLEFTRIVEVSCATEVVVPSQNIRASLPLNTPVRVEIRVPQSGDVNFACGMGMHKGAVVVQ